MPDQSTLHFVGSLELPDGDQRTAFVCHAATFLVTANHNMPDIPTAIQWTHFATGQTRELTDWVYLERDFDSDVAVLGINEDLLKQELVPALPPFELQQAIIEARYYALVEYLEHGEVAYEWDPGTARIIGSRMRQPHRMKVEAPQVTPGCSGAPLVIDTVCGPIIVGMVSARYNSGDHWNSHIIWAVHPKSLRRALNRAVSKRIAGGHVQVSRQFLASLGIDISELPEEVTI